MDLDLQIKIDKTKNRLQQFIDYFGIDGVYISYSGGKDSEVLCHLARELYPNIKIVFSNTGMEFPETVKQVLKRKSEGWNIDIVTPKRTFVDVWKNTGYPVISKTTSMAINRFRNTKDPFVKEKRLGNVEGYKVGTIPKKWHKLAKEGSFKISERCCDVLKKAPLKNYAKKHNRKPIMATMKDESNQRALSLTTCNILDDIKGRSNPMQFWKTEDVWKYIDLKQIEISKAYTVHGYSRTGCFGCLFGCYKGADENRMIKLKETHPKLHKFLGEKMDYKKICNEIGIKFE